MSQTPLRRDQSSFPPEASAAVVVAHPDDETLWAGGFILEHPEWKWTIVTLCRQSDPDRAPRFARALNRYGARGGMRDMNDAPDQAPLSPEVVENEVIAVLGRELYDVVITHGPRGEYTRHLRHEETFRAVSSLWKTGRISAGEIWSFAYEDGARKYYPKAIHKADIVRELSPEIWKEKYRILTEIYDFSPESWEAQTTPRVEAFWRFDDAGEIDWWHAREGRSV